MASVFKEIRSMMNNSKAEIWEKGVEQNFLAYFGWKADQGNKAREAQVRGHM